MANTGVTGRIIIQDESGTALSGTALANVLLGGQASTHFRSGLAQDTLPLGFA